MLSVIIEDGITSIGYGAFAQFTRFYSITIPDTVTSIQDAAFYESTNLTSVALGRGITHIYASAFRGCQSLKSIEIPAYVIFIGMYAFYECSALESVRFSGKKSPTFDVYVFVGCDQLNYINVPFYYQGEKFDTKSVQKDSQPMGDCGDNLTWTLDMVTYKLTISGIGAMDNFTSHNSMLLDLQSLNNVTVPWSVYQSSIKSVIIERRVTSIGKGAFSNCNALTSVTIGSGITFIGDNAFQGCSALETINFQGTKVPIIGSNAFASCNIKTINVPFNYRGDTFGGISVTKPETSPESSGGGAVAGIVIGTFAGVSVIVGAVGIFLFLKKKQNDSTPEASDQEDPKEATVPEDGTTPAV